MLTLTDSSRFSAFTVFRDVSYGNGVRTLTPAFYVLPDAPRLAIDDDGGPSFCFWWYRRSLDQAAAANGLSPLRAGGLLMATVQLGPNDAERAQLKRELADHFQLAGGEATVRLLPMPFVSGTVQIAFAGIAQSDGDLVHQIAGNGPAKLMGDEQATFAIDLTQDGAALLAQSITNNLDVLYCRYDLVFEYHLDNVRLRVWCDPHKAQTAAQSQASAGALNPLSLRQSLVSAQIAGIAIESDAPLPSDQQAALEKLGQQLLDASLATTIIMPDGKNVRADDGSFSGTLNHTFSTSFQALQHTSSDALVKLAVDPSMRDTRFRTFDLANGARPLDVLVQCVCDFTTGPIIAVHFFIAYDGTGPDGKAIHTTADSIFKAAQSSFRFYTLASEDQRNYRWHADVTYRDGTSATIGESESAEQILIVDVEGLGVLSVEVVLGDVPLSVVTSVIVDLDYAPAQATEHLILDGAHVADRWQIVVANVDVAAVRWRATFLTLDHRRVVGEWNAGASRIIIDSPANLGVYGGVSILSAGDFSGIAQLLVDLESASGASDSVQLSFVQPGQAQSWQPQLPQGGALAYRARRTVIGQDGTTRTLAWTAEDSPLLVVADASRFTVQVVGRLLDLGGTWSAAVVAFEYMDNANNIDQRDTVVLRDRFMDGAWVVRLGPSGDHAYRYQMTLVPKDGSMRQELPWKNSEDEILVLRFPDV